VTVKGAQFLRAINSSAESKTGAYIAKVSTTECTLWYCTDSCNVATASCPVVLMQLCMTPMSPCLQCLQILLEAIEEVGPDNVVLVCTDSAANCKAAGRIITQKCAVLLMSSTTAGSTVESTCICALPTCTKQMSCIPDSDISRAGALTLHGSRV
jgi:hypothetical protein